MIDEAAGLTDNVRGPGGNSPKIRPALTDYQSLGGWPVDCFGQASMKYRNSWLVSLVSIVALPLWSADAVADVQIGIGRTCTRAAPCKNVTEAAWQPGTNGVLLRYVIDRANPQTGHGLSLFHRRQLASVRVNDWASSVHVVSGLDDRWLRRWLRRWIRDERLALGVHSGAELSLARRTPLGTVSVYIGTLVTIAITPSSLDRQPSQRPRRLHVSIQPTFGLRLTPFASSR